MGGLDEQVEVTESVSNADEEDADRSTTADVVVSRLVGESVETTECTDTKVSDPAPQPHLVACCSEDRVSHDFSTSTVESVKGKSRKPKHSAIPPSVTSLVLQHVNTVLAERRGDSMTLVPSSIALLEAFMDVERMSLLQGTPAVAAASSKSTLTDNKGRRVRLIQAGPRRRVRFCAFDTSSVPTPEDDLPSVAPVDKSRLTKGSTGIEILAACQARGKLTDAVARLISLSQNVVEQPSVGTMGVGGGWMGGDGMEGRATTEEDRAALRAELHEVAAELGAVSEWDISMAKTAVDTLLGASTKASQRVVMDDLVAQWRPAARFLRDSLTGLLAENTPSSGPALPFARRIGELLNSNIRFHLRTLFNEPLEEAVPWLEVYMDTDDSSLEYNADDLAGR